MRIWCVWCATIAPLLDFTKAPNRIDGSFRLSWRVFIPPHLAFYNIFSTLPQFPLNIWFSNASQAIHFLNSPKKRVMAIIYWTVEKLQWHRVLGSHPIKLIINSSTHSSRRPLRRPLSEIDNLLCLQTFTYMSSHLSLAHIQVPPIIIDAFIPQKEISTDHIRYVFTTSIIGIPYWLPPKVDSLNVYTALTIRLTLACPMQIQLIKLRIKSSRANDITQLTRMQISNKNNSKQCVNCTDLAQIDEALYNNQCGYGMRIVRISNIKTW